MLIESEARIKHPHIGCLILPDQRLEKLADVIVYKQRMSKGREIVVGLSAFCCILLKTKIIYCALKVNEKVANIKYYK